MLEIPAHLLPADGRFGCGPARIRTEAVQRLGSAHDLLGTSHRQHSVRSLVGRVQEGLAALYSAPGDYRVLLGNGGATSFWDAATCSLIDAGASFGVFGEFGSKFAEAAARAPFVASTQVFAAEPGGRALPDANSGSDFYAWPQNETSTGVAAPVQRVADPNGLTAIDATSAAGGMAADLTETDVYYFSGQKNFAADGGLWFAICSPSALERIDRVTNSGHWIPDTLNLQIAVTNSAKQQTLNTPAIATLFLVAEQLDWLHSHGGLEFATTRTAANAATLYSWAENNPLTSCFAPPEYRSPVVGCIDIADSVDAAELCRHARANGIIDIEPYRKLGRNQIRVGMFPSVPTSDVAALTECLDWLLPRLANEHSDAGQERQ